MKQQWWVLLPWMISTTGAMQWHPRTSFPGDGRHHAIAFANETHGFVLGGSTRTVEVSDDLYLYDANTDDWTMVVATGATTTPPPRSFGYGIVLPVVGHTKAYIGFGAGADDGSSSSRLNDLWELDMETLEWRQLSSCPCIGRRHPSMVPVRTDDGTWNIHVGLGDSFDANGQFVNLNDYWSYDIGNDTWSPLPDFPSSERHHPFFFALGNESYVGLGHSSGYTPYIERDFYSYHTANNEWKREPDFSSVDISNELRIATTEARVAGTEFSIEFPLVGSVVGNDTSKMRGSLGFVLSGDGDDHRSMPTGEFHAFFPSTGSPRPGLDKAEWMQLTPHPGGARWAPSSFVLRNTAQAYFCCGYDRATGILHADLWTIGLSSLFSADLVSTGGEQLNSGGVSYAERRRLVVRLVALWVLLIELI